MRRPGGRRSSSDFRKTWTCSHGHRNPPVHCEFFTIPALICGCGCKEEYEDEFDFSLSDIKVNGHKLLGDPLLAKSNSEFCVPLAFAKQMEITKNVKAIMQNKEPSYSHVMKVQDLVTKYQEIAGPDQELDVGTEVVLMARILKEEGIRNMNGSTIFKASNVSAICKDDTAGIVTALANGFPLHSGFYQGRKLGIHRFCRTYMPPSPEKVKIKAASYVRQRYIHAHAVVLVGAGRKKRKDGKKGRLYYYFLNSWERFCVRKNKRGKIISHGIGKVDATRLLRNVIRVSRFKEAPTNRSFVAQEYPVPYDCHNRDLLTDKFTI